MAFNLLLLKFVLLAAGNMRHLIVEACIARNLLDTSAYLWPGYVNARSSQIPRNIPSQTPGWSSLMKGSPLTPSLLSTLVSVPASRYATATCMYVPFYCQLFVYIDIVANVCMYIDSLI